MQDLLPYLPIDRLHALHNGSGLPDRAVGSALFADISGFTPLTGALAKELGRQRGAETVLDVINPIYEALITCLHTYHGAVISFAGDSITCWMDGDDGRRAVACALEMQAMMAHFGLVTTPGGTQVMLSIKISVAAGPARRFLAGDPAVHNFEALAGATLERMALAEQQAEKGEVVVSQEVVDQLGADLLIHEWRAAENEGLGGADRRFAVVAGLASPVSPDPWPALPEGALADSQLRPWIDEPIYWRLASGAAYIAELRPAVSLFLKFGGIDYDGDDQAGDKLDTFIRWVQQILQRYEGTMLQLTIGDKGSNLLAVFGAPIAHDDDAVRAAAAGLELSRLPDHLVFTGPLKIGISQGMVWAGACGGRVRCIYTVMGDEVNMAARLMAKAAPGQVLVNQTVADAAQHSCSFRALGAIQVKGRVEPLPVAEALGQVQTEGAPLGTLFNSPLVGREAYLEELQALLAAASAGKGQVIRLEGPAGVGKSHLAAEFTRQAAAQGWQTANGLAQSITQTTPYLPWAQVFATLLGLAGLPTETRAAHLAAHFAAEHPDWLERMPVLSDLLGIEIPPSPVTAMLEPRQRQQVLFGLVVDILKARVQQAPLLILLEDVHWLDEASTALTGAAARGIAASPAVLLVVQRPPLEGQAILPELDALDAHHAIMLGDLSIEGTGALLTNRLGGPISPLALGLVMAQAQGNPFFTEELSDALREMGHLECRPDGGWDLSAAAQQALIAAGCLEKIDGAWRVVAHPPLSAANLNLPDSIQSTVLARMDRLSEPEKLTIKVASVIGRTFSQRILRGVHPSGSGDGRLEGELASAFARDFVRLEQPGEDPVYIFKHNTTQEVAYSTLLFAQRSRLHADVAGWYEQAAGSPPLEELTLETELAVHYPLLAHHWRKAEQPARERIYDGLAGQQAARQFANESAIAYFTRALELADDDQYAERFKLLSLREAVLHVLGQRDVQKADLEALQAIAQQTGDGKQRAQAALHLAIYYNACAQSPSAAEAAQEAVNAAQAAGDTDLETQALLSWGRSQALLQQFNAAHNILNKALELSEFKQDLLLQGRALFELGLTENAKKNYEPALTFFTRAKAAYEHVAFRTGEIQCLAAFASVYQNQGLYGPAQEKIRQQYALARATGWRWYEAYSLYTIGNLNFYLGEYRQCGDAHRQALEIWREVAARDYEAISLDTLGLVDLIQGDFARAEANARQALHIHTEVEDSTSQGYDYSHLGLILLAAGQPAAAAQAHRQALYIRQELLQDSSALDDLAGLVRVALAEWKLDEAAGYARQVLAGIAENGPDVLEFPVWVYLTCYRALFREEPALAREALKAGWQALNKSAQSIQDPVQRAAFINNVLWNRELAQVWKDHEAG